MTDTNNIEPKPCPFCGKTNAKRHCDHASGWIGCECGASGPRINLDVDRYPGDSFRPNEEQKVVSAWNRRALSARASAGEGGEAEWITSLRNEAMQAAMKDVFWLSRDQVFELIGGPLTAAPQPAPAVFYDIPGSGGTMHFQGDKPAQAGARDNCPRDCGCIVHCRREQIVAAGYAERDGGQHAGRETRDVGDVQMARHWIDRYASGIDDEPQMDLIASALAAAPQPQESTFGHGLTKEPVTITPAHGDGEAYPTSSDREVLLYLMQQFDAESWQCPCGRSESCADMDSALYLRNYLTTRPTPEARDAARWQKLEELVVPQRDDYWYVHPGAGADRMKSAVQLRNEIDAALALPAQGEGKNG